MHIYIRMRGRGKTDITGEGHSRRDGENVGAKHEANLEEGNEEI